MDRKARTRESTVNDYLAAALNSRHPRWSVEAESTRVLADHLSKVPDIVVRMPGGMSVILETEYFPAATVESDASGRLGKNLLGKNLLETGETVEQVVAVRLPESLSRAPQAELAAVIAQEHFDYCLLIGTRPESPNKFPSAGWINGDIDALANLVEAIAVSERQLSHAADPRNDRSTFWAVDRRPQVPGHILHAAAVGGLAG